MAPVLLSVGRIGVRSIDLTIGGGTLIHTSPTAKPSLWVPLSSPVAGYRIEIVPYDPSWPRAYEEERHRLEQAIGGQVVRFEHMGSTSVPGLESKPIID